MRMRDILLISGHTLALDKARQFQNRTPKQTGSALTWFLKARSIYSQSAQAEKGIQLSAQRPEPRASTVPD